MEPSQIHHLKGLIERTNSTNHPYLACICGMWSQEYGVLDKSNPFNDDLLHRWWRVGWEANYFSHDISVSINKKQKKHEENWFNKMFKKK